MPSQRMVEETAPHTMLLLQTANFKAEVCDRASVLEMVDRGTSWSWSAPVNLPLGAWLCTAPLNVLHLAWVLLPQGIVNDHHSLCSFYCPNQLERLVQYSLATVWTGSQLCEILVLNDSLAECHAQEDSFDLSG